VSRPGVSGDLLVWELSGWLGSVLSVVGVLEFGWWNVAVVLVQAPVVEPVDPPGGGDLDAPSPAISARAVRRSIGTSPKRLQFS